MFSAKPHFNILILGPRQSGKGITVGQLILKAGKTDPLIIENMQQNYGKKYRWALTYLREEREGVSIDPIPYVRFDTETKTFDITDAPGHPYFYKNLICHASRDQIALMIVSPDTIGIESESELISQLTCAKILGIKQFIICVNKFDEEKIAWSQDIFEDVKKRVSGLFSSRSIGLGSVSFVPISAIKSDNLFVKSSNLNWYTGKTLIQALNTVLPFPKLKNEPLRIPLSSQYKASKAGTVLSGAIESGQLKIGMSVYFSPVDVKGVVKSVETTSGGNTDIAEAGDHIGFTVACQNIEKLTRGVVCGELDDNPPKKIGKSDSFEALVVMTSDPEHFKEERKLTIDCHMAHFTCHLKAIGEKFTKNGRIKESFETLEVGDSALVTLIPDRDVCLELFSDFPALGRFGIRGDQIHNVGVGIIKSINRES